MSDPLLSIRFTDRVSQRQGSAAAPQFVSPQEVGTRGTGQLRGNGMILFLGGHFGE